MTQINRDRAATTSAQQTRDKPQNAPQSPTIPPTVAAPVPILTVQLGAALAAGNLSEMAQLVKSLRAAGLKNDEQNLNIAANALYRQALNELQQSGRIAEMVPEMQRQTQRRQGQIMDSLPKQVRLALTTAMLGGQARLSYDAFIEQLASNLVYANDLDFSDDKSPTGGKAVNGQPQQGSGRALLRAFKYGVTPVYLGKWGLQMRVFYPLEGATYDRVVVAFRGTETVVLPTAPLAKAKNNEKFRVENEKDLDTATDMSKADTAYTQYEQNADLIDRVINFASAKAKGKSLVSAGHSLGGGLAQIAAARHPEFTQLLTFQAPGINPDDVQKLVARTKLNLRQEPVLQIRNYRTTYDTVPYAGKGDFPGVTYSFERSLHNPALDLIKAGGDNHNFPMLGEFLETLLKSGQPLSPQDQAIVSLGKQSPAEKTGADDQSLLMSRSFNAPLLRGGPAQAQILPAMFSGHIFNAVANNVVYNNIVDDIQDDLKAVIPTKVRARGTPWHRKQLKDAGQNRVKSWKFNRLTEKANLALKDYLVESENPFMMELSTVMNDLKHMTNENLMKLVVDPITKIALEGKTKLFKLALSLRSGQQDTEVNEIVEENKQRIILYMPLLWYSEFVTEQELYEAVRERYENL